MQDDLYELFREIAAHAKHRHARGTGVLFVGPGKAAALEMITKLARRPVYRVDLNAVTRKYIGETEKNLSMVFDAAEQRGAILFLDEADALLGKRSAITDSHDRYANTEVNHLFLRIESFRGVVILAALAKTLVDSAVRHRVRYVVDLPELEATTDAEIVAENISAIGTIYFAAMLEELKLFQVVDRFAALFASGQLPVGRGIADKLLRSHWQEGQRRLSETDRRNIYGRTLGMPGGDASITPNREFNDLWVRFIAIVAAFEAQERLCKAGQDLAVNLTLHGYGMASLVAAGLREQIRDIVAILSDPEIRSAFGARDMWQVVDQVASRELGGARNTHRYATMAVSGATVFDWLAKHATVLQHGESCRAEAGLVDACEQWLAASGLADETAETLSQAKEAPSVPSRIAAVSPGAREILAALGLESRGE